MLLAGQDFAHDGVDVRLDGRELVLDLHLVRVAPEELVEVFGACPVAHVAGNALDIDILEFLGAEEHRLYLVGHLRSERRI